MKDSKKTTFHSQLQILKLKQYICNKSIRCISFFKQCIRNRITFYAVAIVICLIFLLKPGSINIPEAINIRKVNTKISNAINIPKVYKDFKTSRIQQRYRNAWCNGRTIKNDHIMKLNRLNPGLRWNGLKYFQFLKRQTIKYRESFCESPSRDMKNDTSRLFKYHIDSERSFIFNELLPNLPKYEEARLFKNKRGLVFTVANKKIHLDSVERTMKLLQRDSLEAEVWTFGDNITKHSLCERLDVTCRDMYDMYDLGLSKEIIPTHMYEFCIYAIFFSSFREIINLDTDAAPLRKISYMFETEQYKRNGQIFYSDWWGTNTIDWGQVCHKNSPLWDFVRVKPYPCRELETGILLFDKKKNWQELNLALHLARHEILMPLITPTGYTNPVWGDKDIWKIAFSMLRTPFYVGTAVMLGKSTPFKKLGSFGHIDPNDPSKILFVHQPKSLDLPFISNFKKALVDLRCSNEKKYYPHIKSRACWDKKSGDYNYRTGKMEGVKSEWVYHKCKYNCNSLSSDVYATYVSNASFV